MSNDSDQSQFSIYIRENNVEGIKRVIDERNIDLNLIGRNNPLLEAIIYNTSYEIVKLLLDSGAKVDIGFDSYDRTPLNRSFYNQNDDVTELLVDAGSNPVYQDDTYGRSCFHMVYNLNHKNIVRILRKMLISTVLHFDIESINDTNDNSMTPYEILYLYLDQDIGGEIRECLELLELYGAEFYDHNFPSLNVLSMRATNRYFIDISSLPLKVFP